MLIALCVAWRVCKYRPRQYKRYLWRRCHFSSESVRCSICKIGTGFTRDRQTERRVIHVSSPFFVHRCELHPPAVTNAASCTKRTVRVLFHLGATLLLRMLVLGMGSEFLAEYASLLRALQRNDKAQINALTMLADDNRSLADGIVRIIERHVLAVRVGLRAMHSIMRGLCAASGKSRDF